MAEAPSIGEAISLQGRNQFAEKLGEMSFRAGEAEKNRQLKAGVAAKTKEDKDKEKVFELFRQKDALHPLVMPEARKLLESTIQSISDIQSSGSPYGTNQLGELMLNVDQKMGELKSFSRIYSKFDEDVKFVDGKKKFTGEHLQPFLNVYKNAKSREDLLKYKDQNPNSMDNYFGITPEGLPVLNAVDAIPYQKDLADKVQKLGKTILGRNVVSIPDAYGAKELQTQSVRPLTIADAESAYTDPKNKGLYLDGRPRSIEDEVIDYMTLNPEVVQQVSANARLNIVPQEDGTYTEEDFTKAKNALMMSVSQFSNPELKGKLIQEKKGNNFSVINPGTLQDPVTPTDNLEIVDLKTPGEKVNNKKTTTEQRKTKLGLPSYSAEDIQVGPVKIDPSNLFTDSYGNSLNGTKEDVQIDRVRTLPYKLVNGDKIIAHANEFALIKGVAPFVEFSHPGGTYYTPLENYSYAKLAGNKWNLQQMGTYLNIMKEKATKATNALQGKTFTSLDQINNLVKQYVKK